jgi:hypothetical protein
MAQLLSEGLGELFAAYSTKSVVSATDAIRSPGSCCELALEDRSVVSH